MALPFSSAAMLSLVLPVLAAIPVCLMHIFATSKGWAGPCSSRLTRGPVLGCQCSCLAALWSHSCHNLWCMRQTSIQLKCVAPISLQ